MEGLLARAYKGLSGYWRRKRGYERLNLSGRRRKSRVDLAVAGSDRRRRWFWKTKITPKLRISPKKFFIGLRDAYVTMMLRLANSSVISSGGIGGVVGDGIGWFGTRPLKEYDEKMIVEIYKSPRLVQGQLVTRDSAEICTQIVGRW